MDHRIYVRNIDSHTKGTGGDEPVDLAMKVLVEQCGAASEAQTGMKRGSMNPPVL